MESSTFAYVDEIFKEVPPITPQEITEDIRNRIVYDHSDDLDAPQIERAINDINRCKEILQQEITNQSDLISGCDSKESAELKTKLKSVIFEVRDIFNHIRKQMILVKDSENHYHDEISKVQKNISKLTDFADFLGVLSEKHDHLDVLEVVGGIQKMTKILSETTEIQRLKEKYETEEKILQYYIENFVKPLNGGNLGSTCSICMTRAVDHYFNPCGHTICGECYLQSINMNGSHNDTCCLCRSPIVNCRKLFFN